MKKSFKRFLSSVLATVMAVAGMSIGMTTNAMAAAYDQANVTQTATSKTWDFSGNAIGVTLKSGDTVNGIVIGTIASTKLHASGYFTTKAGSTISIPVPVNSEGKLTAVCNGDQSSRYATLEGNNIVMAKAGSSANFTAAETADGDLDLSFAGGEFKCLTFTVELTSGSFGEVATYTLTGACSGLAAGTKFDLVGGDKTYEATVAADGASYSVSTQAGAFDTTVTYTADLANYTASYDTASGVTLTVDAADATKFTATPAITFTEDQLTAIPAGTYNNDAITAGKPNFDVSGLVGSAGKYTGDIKFILSDTATVTVNGKCGSSTAGKTASASIGSQSYTAEAGGSNTDYVFSNVAAGETTLTLASTDTTFQIVSITISYGETSTESTSEEQSSETTSEEQSSEVSTEAPAGAITDKSAIANFDSVTGTDTTGSDVTIGDFTILAGSSSALDKSSYKFDGLGEFSTRYKTGGKTTLTSGVPSNRAIKFTTAGAGVVQVAARGSGNSSRTINVYGSDGTVVGSATSENQVGVILTATLPKADTYYIASPDNGFAIYSVNVVIGEGTEAVTAGNVFVETSDAYMIAKVSAADLAANKIVVSANGGSVEDTVVYKAAIIDGHYITAEELGADYIYVVKAVNAVVNGLVDAAKAFTVSFE